jgi:hypothetical protein
MPFGGKRFLGSMDSHTRSIGKCMVCHLTVGKKGYEDFDKDMQALLSEADRLRLDLVRLIDENVAVFGEYSRASKMPRGNEQEKAQRTAAVQTALMAATEVPLRMVELEYISEIFCGIDVLYLLRSKGHTIDLMILAETTNIIVLQSLTILI